MFALISPATFAIFAAGFLCAWLFDGKRVHLLVLAVSIALFSVAAACQILSIPRDGGLNAMISGALYTASILTAMEGVLRRHGRTIGWWLPAIGLATIMVLLWYFYYVTPSLIVRIYVQNFGYGLMLLYAALRLADQRVGKPIDRAVFWAFLAFALHFFPRTVTTLGLIAPATRRDFAGSSFWVTLHISLTMFGVILALTLLAAAMVDRMDDLKADRDADPLTGLLNRRGFDEKGKSFIADPEAMPVGVIVCDIDRFKSVNDTYGHSVGDRTLQAFATVLVRTIRKGDLAARIGGEEFAILLRQAHADDAERLAERIRTTLEEQRPLDDIGPASITASFGVAEARPGEPLWQAVRRADMMLYSAKNSGRNRTAVWDNREPLSALSSLPPTEQAAIIALRRDHSDLHPTG